MRDVHLVNLEVHPALQSSMFPPATGGVDAEDGADGSGAGQVFNGVATNDSKSGCGSAEGREGRVDEVDEVHAGGAVDAAGWGAVGVGRGEAGVAGVSDDEVAADGGVDDAVQTGAGLIETTVLGGSGVTSNQ